MGRGTVMLSPRGRILRLLPLKEVWRVSREVAGAARTAEKVVERVRRVWRRCILGKVLYRWRGRVCDRNSNQKSFPIVARNDSPLI
jgi:hypothetical protein